MDQEISRLRDKTDKHDDKLSMLQTEVSTLKTQAEQIHMQLDSVENRLQNIYSTYGTYKRELEIIQDNCKMLLAKIEKLEDSMSKDIRDLQIDMMTTKKEVNQSTKLWHYVVTSLITLAMSLWLNKLLAALS